MLGHPEALLAAETEEGESLVITGLLHEDVDADAEGI